MKKFISILFATMLATQTWAFEIGNLQYTITDETNHYVSVTGSTDPMGDLLIESEVVYPETNGVTYTVTSIGNYAFYLCGSLTSITIPNSVISISDYAFSCCSGLVSISIPSSVISIGRGAFSNCSGLTSVTIPNSVTEIGHNAFQYCSGLTSVTIPNSVTSIGNEMFSGCSGLSSMTIPNSVTEIGHNAFRDCRGLTSVTIPNSVTSIGDAAFHYCSGLTSVTIPNSVISIGGAAFANCSGLTSVIIPNSVTEIGDVAFSECGSITFVTIPKSVISIGENAFFGCNAYFYCEPKDMRDSWGSSLLNKNVIMGVETIVADDFVYGIIYGENSIRTEIIQYTGDSISANIPSSVKFNGKEYVVTSVRDGAFNDYNNLDYAAYGSAYYIGNEENPYLVLMSAKNKKIESCEINNRCRIIYEDAFSGCNSLTEISIPKSVVNIGGNAFYGCTELQRAEFASEADLYKIKFGNSYSNPLYQTHHLCIKGEEVTKVVIPDSIKSIGDYTFYGCSNLSSITIGNSVETIGQCAFYGCNGLTSMSIPIYVKSIGVDAFTFCYNIQKTEFASIESLCSIKFGNANANPLSYAHNLYIGGEKVVNLVISETVSSIGDYAFYNCTSLASVVISDSVNSIGTQAFYDCNRLASIDIPNSVSSIGANAFSGCSYLKSLSYNSNTIGAHFNNISALKSIFIGDSIKTISGSEFNGCDNLVNVISMAAVPPTLNGDPYTYADTIYVPAASVEAYKAAPVWKRKEILPLDYYNIQAKADTSRGTVSGTGNFAAKEAVTIYATPAENYHFKAWSDGNTENPRTILVNADVNVTAIFEGDERTISAIADAVLSGGSVTGGQKYHYGDTITLTAAPNIGHHFVKWSDGSTDATRTIVVTGDLQYTAEFAIDTHTITIAATIKNGTVSGADTYNYGDNATLTATPAEGYHFVKWSDGNTDNPRVITVNGDMQIAAEFEKDSENTNPGTAVIESAAGNLVVYAHGNTIVVENATAEIRVYDTMGRLIVETPHCDISTEIRVSTTGLYIVKVGNVAKRVMVN
jgi:hypothetical protein